MKDQGDRPVWVVLDILSYEKVYILQAAQATQATLQIKEEEDEKKDGWFKGCDNQVGSAGPEFAPPFGVAPSPHVPLPLAGSTAQQGPCSRTRGCPVRSVA